MPILNPSEVAPEREEIIGDSIMGNLPGAPGIKCARDISPLVMTALLRTNNPYVAGKAGFEAAGISFAKDGNVEDPAQFAMRMMPFTAEVLICLTCSRDDLRRYAADANALQGAALDYMEKATIESLAEATVFVSQRLEAITKSRAVTANEKPKAAGLEGNGDSTPKRHVRIGSRKS